MKSLCCRSRRSRRLSRLVLPDPKGQTGRLPNDPSLTEEWNSVVVGSHGQTRGRGRPQGTGPGPHRHLHKPTRTAGEHQFHTDPTTDNMKLVSDTHTWAILALQPNTSVCIGGEWDGLIQDGVGANAPAVGSKRNFAHRV